MARYDGATSLYDDAATLYDDTGSGTTGPPGTGDLSGAARTTTLLSSPFDSAFYSGSPVVTDSPALFQVSLGGHQYRIDPSQYRRNTLPTLRPPQDNSAEPGEQSLNTESVWRRSQGNWILGTGQSYYDDIAEPASNRTQFYRSLGINPWTQRQLTLQHDTRSIMAASSTNLRLFATPTALYATNGTELVFTSDPESESPTWRNANIGAATAIEDLTVVGSKVYAALGPSGVRTTTFGATSSAAYSSYAATLISFANGFMLGAKPGDISTIDAAGTASSIYTHFDPNMLWTDIESTPRGAYVCGNSFGRAEIYFVGLDTSTGSLLPPTFAGSLPNGETINRLAYYQGLMLVGTSAGLRLGQIDSQNGINYGPLITVPGGVTAFEPQAEFCWFSWSNYDASNTGLGRVLLSRDSEVGLPAYASDLMASTQGVVSGIASYNGRRYFGVGAAGVFAEFDDYVSSGSIDSGFIRFGTTERKVAVSVEVRHDALPAGGAVTASLIKDDGVVVPCGISQDANSLGPVVPFPASQAQAEALRVFLTIRRSTDRHSTPTLRRWTLRATPTPIRTDEIVVPIILREVVNTSEEVGQEIHFDTLAEFQFLKTLESDRRVVSYEEGGATYSVQIDRVMVRPEKWNSDNSFFNGLVFVRLLTIGA